MKAQLPPLRSLQAFEAFGRLGSVAGAAQELNVTSGAISQQLKVLEEYIGIGLVFKDGRKSILTPEGTSYFDLVTSGFDKFAKAQSYIEEAKAGTDLRISGLPTLLLKWLNPRLHEFQATTRDIPVRLESTYIEPDPQMNGEMFRLTYGAIAKQFPHAKTLFTDVCFPVCSPNFLRNRPQANTLEGLLNLPYIEIDWGPAYRTVPRWPDWFLHHEMQPPEHRPIAVHSLSSSALEASATGQGITLAQLSFAQADLELGRLVRLSDSSLTMPEPYFVCWGQHTLEKPLALSFLQWLESVATDLNLK